MSRKRLANFSSDDRMLLLDLIDERREILSKASDANSLQKKEQAWIHVTEAFNYNRQATRHKDALQVLFANMKTTSRKKFREWKQKRSRTGNVDSFEELADEVRRIDSMLPGFLDKPTFQFDDDTSPVAAARLV